MKLPRLSTSEAATLLTLLATSAPVAATMLTCNKLVVDGHKFNFEALKGPHSVVTNEFHPPTYSNATYTLDICAFLKRSDSTDKNAQCANGARVCGIKRLWNPETNKNEIEAIIPIAGNVDGKAFEWEAKRFKTSDLPEDAGKEGVRVTLKAGMFQKRPQRAVVEFHCNKTMEGNENEWPSDEKYEQGTPDSAIPLLRRMDEVGAMDDPAEEGYPEKQLRKDDAALIWNGRKLEDNMETLYLTWYTKYACESLGEDEVPASKHWGFFTWLVILAFLGVASYLIFGSWLNYNRYGARGWDLLPHGDTLRDVPYLLKDWTRRVLNTVQGSGSRGGYSAV